MKTIQPVYGRDFAPGYTLFIKNTRLISQGIEWFESLEEACDFIASHVCLVVNENTGVECAEHGVQYTTLTDYFDNTNIQVVCREPEGLDGLTIGQVLDCAGKMYDNHTPYDYTGLVGFIGIIIIKLSGIFHFLRKLPVPLHIPGARVCSAFVGDCYKHTDKYKNTELFKNYNISRIDPVLLYNRFPWKPFRFDKTR